MWGNAFLLSVLYLLTGIGVEVARRLYPSRLLQRLSLSLDSLPARALELVGAMEPLRTAYFTGRLTEAQVRILFGITTVGVIFMLALVVGSVMGGVRYLLQRRAARP
ncbi:hypothetical protein DRW03_26515 [Corallococcus sp. H22C18031201]|uniref:hypothetical protein n=1 Tax=Citreicoccus inhibens TaxID=2849499 RepID=UPI000E75E810|nr:hypothetical protein [Citreicoccus inhibens]MBU8899525.1 hypothetical protein [Citreicoccus inhibens]RJS18145.1 hypothetical protein DRW03_26515 [Corallococcus sp. H22C18031201]